MKPLYTTPVVSPSKVKTNIELLTEVGQTSKLSLLELYAASGQGEGKYQGVPSTFVRFAGCSVGCGFCDTVHSWRARTDNLVDPMTLVERTIEVSSHTHVVVTGGEPFEQSHAPLYAYMHALSERGYNLTIETSGIIIPQHTSPQLNWNKIPMLYSVSPKLASAKTRFTQVDLSQWLHAVRPNATNAREVQFKFVIEDFELDMLEVTHMVGKLQKHANMFMEGLFIILQPCTPGPKEVASLDDLRSKVLDRQLQLQEYVMYTKWASDLMRQGAIVCVRPQQHALLYGHKKLV